MKKSLLLIAALAFAGAVTGCASEEDTDLTLDADTTMMEPVEPMPEPMPVDTMAMPVDTMAAPADTAAGAGL